MLRFFFISSSLFSFSLDCILVGFAALNLLVDCLQKHTNVISIFSRQNDYVSLCVCTVHCNIKLVLSQHPIWCVCVYSVTLGTDGYFMRPTNPANKTRRFHTFRTANESTRRLFYYKFPILLFRNRIMFRIRI